MEQEKIVHVSDILTNNDGYLYQAVYIEVKIPQPAKDYPPGHPPVFAIAKELQIRLVR